MCEGECYDTPEPAAPPLGDGAMPEPSVSPAADGAMQEAVVYSPYEETPIGDEVVAVLPVVVEMVPVDNAALPDVTTNNYEDSADPGYVGHGIAMPPMPEGTDHWASQYPYVQGGVTPCDLGPIEQLADVSFDPTGDLANLIASQEETLQAHEDHTRAPVPPDAEGDRAPATPEPSQPPSPPSVASPIPDQAGTSVNAPVTSPASPHDSSPSDKKSQELEDQNIRNSLDEEYQTLSSIMDQQDSTIKSIINNI